MAHEGLELAVTMVRVGFIRSLNTLVWADRCRWEKGGWVVDHGGLELVVRGGVELVVTLVEGVSPIALGLSY